MDAYSAETLARGNSELEAAELTLPGITAPPTPSCTPRRPPGQARHPRQDQASPADAEPAGQPTIFSALNTR